MRLFHRSVNFAKNCNPDYGTDSSTAKIQLKYRNPHLCVLFYDQYIVELGKALHFLKIQDFRIIS